MHNVTALKRVLFLLLIVICSSLNSQNIENNIRFEHLTSADGLSTVTVRDIIQDQYGFMWFATTQGLNTYDGYKISVFNNDPLNSKSLSDDNIKSLYEDKQGNLWAGTRNNGLNKYHRETNTFIRYIHNSEDNKSISDSYVLDIFEDSKGVFWIGTSDGLNKMDRENGTFTSYKNKPDDDNSIVGNQIVAINEDASGQLWIGTSAGLSKFNRSDESFTSYKNIPNNLNSLGAGTVYTIHTDSDENIVWIGTRNGLNKFNKKENTFVTYLFDTEEQKNNKVYKITEDSYGNFWVSIRGKGLALFNKYTEQFITIKPQITAANNLKGNIVSEIYEDSSKVLWIGTTSGGVNIFKPHNVGLIKHESKITNNSNDGVVTSIVEDTDDGIWVSNMIKEISHISNSGKTTKYTLFKKNSEDYIPNYINSVFEDANKNIWAATSNGIYKLDKKTNVFNYEWLTFENVNPSSFNTYKLAKGQNEYIWIGSKIGLIHYNTETKISILYAHSASDLNTISSNYAYNIYEDKSGVLWVGTDKGLNVFNHDTQIFTHYKNDISDTKTISSNSVACVFEDKLGQIWIGTENGLNKFNKKENTFDRYDFSKNLADNTIYSILQDTKNNLWLCSTKSIYRFNLETKHSKIFNKKDGLPVTEFYANSGAMDKKGHFYFGELNGYLEINPDLVEDNKITPKIELVDFKLSNKSVSIKNDSIKSTPKEFYLEKDISVTDTIALSYLNKIFSFEFVSLDFLSPRKNKYAYKMQGFEENWTFTDSKNRIATYTNLNPGTYSFIVKGSNNDGLWNESGKSIVVIITPPWWKTNWAYTLYLISFLSLLFGFIQWRALKLKKDKKILIERVKIKTKDLADKNIQLDNQNIQLQDQATQLQELGKIKASFFANISHEFRTPLTVITGLANKHITKNENETSTQDSQTIKRNAQRLLQLINQLLDLSKLENSQVKLDILKTDILYFTKKIILLNQSLAKDKNIKVFFNEEILSKSLPTKKIDLHFDKEKMQKIITNLISNAIKFTPKEGEIRLSVNALNLDKKKKSHIIIEVTNTGSEIPKNKLPYIFDRFYQVENSNTSEIEGTGIGLALVKELTELHHGTIKVESNSTETTFILKFPYNENLLIEGAKKNKANPIIEIVEENNIISNQKNVSKATNDLELDTETSAKLEILIVEDNPDLRSYITDLLDQDYVVTQAVNGVDGLEMAKKSIPDLIISDVMMPKMDGYELCDKLKTDETTDHIPIILLTAKATQENKLEGLQTGADAYLTKPFDEKELKIRIKNLIDTREKLQKKCQNESFLKPKDVKVTSVQQKFLQKIKEAVEENIDNDQFSVEDLGSKLFMSRSQVHRKLKAITDQSATQFIRNYRLHRAADLLKQESGNITEIAYQVGFSSQTYFSKCFQELFGVSPTEHKKQ